MSKFSVAFYTNNLITKPLLLETLGKAIDFCKQYDGELILTSHFPLTKEYTEFVTEEEYYTKEPDGSVSQVYNWLVKDLNLELDIPYKSFVTGKTRYGHLPIVKQLLLSASNASTDKIIFMEHDCLYSSDYISACLDALESYNLTYVYEGRTFANDSGFWPNSSFVFLSGIAMRKDIMLQMFKRKLQLLQLNEFITQIKLRDLYQPTRLEPVLFLGDDEEKHNLLHEKYRHELILPKNEVFCLDESIEHAILDLKHKLNYSGYVYGDNLAKNHIYWGDIQPITNLINTLNMTHKQFLRWGYGTEIF